jgi:hypothetical protein
LESWGLWGLFFALNQTFFIYETFIFKKIKKNKKKKNKNKKIKKKKKNNSCV